MAFEVSAFYVVGMAMSVRTALDGIQADLSAEGVWVRVTKACAMLFQVLRFDHGSSDESNGEFFFLAIHVLETARLGHFGVVVDETAMVSVDLPPQVIMSMPLSFKQKLQHAFGMDWHASATSLADALAECIETMRSERNLILRPAAPRKFWLELLALLEDYFYLVRGILHTQATISASSIPQTEVL